MEPLPLEVAMIKALADHEAKYGRMNERERLIFQRGFVDGHGHGFATGKAILDQVLTDAGRA